MPRRPRIDNIGYYHVLNRGVEKRSIFLDNRDFKYFLSLINELKNLYHFHLHAYCLMSNHYHLLIETTGENLSLILKQLNHRYTLYFNKRYHRVGTLWQGRFKSWYVYDEHYLQTLTKYIEYNPVKAGITSAVGEYAWASSVSRETPFSDDDATALLKYQKSRVIAQNDPTKQKVALMTLERCFTDHERNIGVIEAVKAGYRQTKIARYLGLSDVTVSKIVKTEKAKETLFEKLKAKGIFWSYSDRLSYTDSAPETTIEHTLKYADYDDIAELFRLYGKRTIFKAWEKIMKNDSRFKKLNLFLARVFFGMDVQSDYFTGEMSEREKKLRLLAS